MANDTLLYDLVRRSRSFEREAHKIFGVYESAPSRLYSLDQSYAKLGALSLRQDELLRQALRCVESELFRAAHVMAWAALMDFVEEAITQHGLVNLAAIRPKWNTASLEDLRESVPESQIIDAGRDLKILTKNQSKALHGLLNKRNECAHPSDFFPDFNQTLGYIAEVMQRIELLQKKHLHP
jgi:hypothetical protein